MTSERERLTMIIDTHLPFTVTLKGSELNLIADKILSDGYHRVTEERMTTEKLCTLCKFCVEEDYGYSNWTMEGTSLDCLYGLNNPLSGEEAPSSYRKDHGVEAAIRFAEECPVFTEGEGPHRDVERETTAEDYRNDAVLYPLLLKRWKK
jgi:hypothetical protein